jgi:hypothetical protein
MNVKQLLILSSVLVIILMVGIFFVGRQNAEITNPTPELFDVQICINGHSYKHAGVNDFYIDWKDRIVELQKDGRVLVIPFERISWISIPKDYYYEFFNNKGNIK